MSPPRFPPTFQFTLSAELEAILAISGGGPVRTLDLDTQAANRVLAGPTSGADAKPTIRALVTADLPAGVGTVTAVTATSPLASTGGATPDISISANPQFTTVELGHATDTTLARSSAGNVTIEGNLVYRAGGTDVPVTDGGTGASSASAAATNLGLGTGDSPQFTAVNVGHASDTTLSRNAAGVLQVEADILYAQNGTDVAVADGGTGASTAATARVNLATAYAHFVQCDAFSPTDAQTIYFGSALQAPITTANVRNSSIAWAGTIVACYVNVRAATAGSNEAWSLYVNLNNTSATLIATVSTSANARVFSNTALSIAVVRGDYIEMYFVNPTWATNPATVNVSGRLIIQ